MGAAVKKFEDVFIKVQRWGQFVDSDLEENCIETSVEFHQPGFLRKFLIMLDDKPVSADDVRFDLDLSLGFRFLPVYLGAS